VHLLGARLAQRPRAFVGGRTRRVDVVHEGQRPRPRARREGATHVAAAGIGVQPALRAYAVRPAHERHDGYAPPASEPGRELRRRVGAAQQASVPHRRHDGDRLDGRPRQLVGHQRGGQSPR
jgi:hypothetical protein